MAPALGQLWRTALSKSVYRVAEIDLSRQGECVRLEFIEAGPWLAAEWAAVAGNGGPSIEESLASCLERPLWVELQWFEHGAATFVREAA